jgi:arabinose operon protein AraL
MRRFRGYIFDLDGTIYLGEQAIPGAPEVVRRLREVGCRVTFISNKPLEPRERYAEKLTRLGIPTDPADVLTSGHVLGRWLAAEAPGAQVFVVGEPPLLAELAAFGLQVTNDAPYSEKADFVVAAFDRTFDYAKLNTAFQAIRRGARLVATNADRTCPVEGGEIPDAAAVISAIEGCTGQKVELVAGKPSPLIIEAGLARMGGLPPEVCLVVGDRLETDVVMAQRAGAASALVLTGVTCREALSASPVQPDYVLESVVELERAPP